MASRIEVSRLIAGITEELPDVCALIVINVTHPGFTPLNMPAGSELKILSGYQTLIQLD